MKGAAYSAVLACLLLVPVGQVLFKVSANALAAGASVWGRQVIVPAIGAIGVYVVVTAAWIWALQYIPLIRAYSILALSFVVVPIASWYYLSERPGIPYFLGVVLILAGVAIILSDR